MAFIKTHDEYSADASRMSVFIECPGRDISVESFLPEEISFKVSSRWESFFGNMENNGIITFADQVTQIFTGNTIQNPILKRKIWKGSDPMTFSLPLIFYSMENAQQLVYKPADNLIKLALPVQNPGTFTLTVPGPLPVVGGGNTEVFEDSSTFTHPKKPLGLPVNIYIGSYASFKSVYITDVDVKFSSITQNGYPVKANVTLSVGLMDAVVRSNSSSIFISEPEEFTMDDLKGMFNALVTAGKNA